MDSLMLAEAAVRCSGFFLRLGDIEPPSRSFGFFFAEPADNDVVVVSELSERVSCASMDSMISSTVLRNKFGLALKSISHTLAKTVINTPGVVLIPSIALVFTCGKGAASSLARPV